MPAISQPNVWKKCRLGNCSESENRRQIFIGSGSVGYWICKSEKPGFIYCRVLIICKDKVWCAVVYVQVLIRYNNIRILLIYTFSVFLCTRRPLEAVELLMKTFINGSSVTIPISAANC